MENLNKESVRLPGQEFWKSGIEYCNEHTQFIGYPFYEMRYIDGVYELYMLDIDNPDSGKYWLIKKSKSRLTDICQDLARKIMNKYHDIDSNFLCGKELIEALKPFPEILREKCLVYSENEFGKIDGKVANGLSRYSERYEIVGIIDSTKAGLDAGEYLDGIKNNIPIFKSIEDALNSLNYTPENFIYGIAPLTSFLNEEQRQIIVSAIKYKMNIINGLPEYFTEDDEFSQKAKEYGVQIYDIRKAPPRNKLHIFTGRILEIKTPVIVVAGTDCAVGKRTTARLLVQALKKQSLKTVFITTGQTGLLQGAKYGIALDVLTSGFATGEVENAIINAVTIEQPDIIIVEGQGALSHPAFTSSSAILRGSLPNAIIIQHPPKRKNHCDYPKLPMPTLESEIKLNELFSKSKVIAITLNHEDMTDHELENTIVEYESKYQLPTTDVLKHGTDKLLKKIFDIFPKLQK